MSIFTIVATSREADIEPTIAAWTRRRLLSPSIWLDPDALDETALKNVPALPVRVLGPDGVTAMTLREAFGSTNPKLIRIMAVQQVVEDVNGGELTEKLLRDFSTALRDRLAESTSLLRINLVVPHGNTTTPKGMLDSMCDVNVVVSPEDRPREGAMDHGLDNPDLFRGHTALACATVGALWSHTSTSAFDRTHGQRSGIRGEIVVVRAAARVVDGRSLLDDVIDELLGEGTGSLHRYQENVPNRTSNDESLVRAACEALLPVDDHVLNFRPPRRDKQEPARQVVQKTLRMLARFALDVTKVRALEWRHSMPSLDAAASTWLHDVPVVDEPPTPQDLQDLAAQAPGMQQDTSQVPLSAPAYRFLWPPLRQLCFGLVDGGAPPEEMRAKFAPAAAVVSHPKWVAPSPQEVFEFDAEEGRVLSSLDVPEDTVRPGDSSAADRLAGRLRKAERKLGNNPEDRVKQTVIASCRKRLDEWRRKSKWDKSLIGMLSKHVNGQIAVARGELTKRREDYDREGKEWQSTLNALEEVQKRLVLHVGVPAALLTLLLVSAGLAAFSSGATFALVLLGFLVMVFLISMVLLSTVAAKATMLEQRLENVEARRRLTVAAVREWPTEAQRLGALYDVLIDWGEIIGWMLHRPFVSVEEAASARLAAPRRPEAFKLGRSHLLRPEMLLVARKVTQDVLSPGWISELYEVVLNATIPERLTNPLPDAQTEPDLAPGPVRQVEVEYQEEDLEDLDHEEPVEEHGPSHARERLLRGFRHKDSGRFARDHLADDVRETMRTLPLVSTVEVLDEQETIAEFLGAVLPAPTDQAPCQQLVRTLFSDTGVSEGRAAVAEVHLWSSTDQLGAESMPVAEHPDVIIHTAGEQPLSDSHQLCLVRLDVSARCSTSDLVLPG